MTEKRNPSSRAASPPVVGVLLAGGRARRMGGGDKCLLPLGGRTVLDHVVERARAQVRSLVLNANGDPARFAGFDLPVVADSIPGWPGPLAGVLAGMEWARAEAPNCPWIATFPTDTPFLPRDLVARLLESAEGAGDGVAVAASRGRRHPVAALWPVSLAEPLRRAIACEGVRKVEVWQARFPVRTAEFEAAPFDPFLNINEPGDLEEAARLLRCRRA